MAEAKKNPIATLKAQAKEFDFSKLRAGKSNIGANSGETMYKDFQRMNFVINGKSIDETSICKLIERAWNQYSFREAITPLLVTPFDERTHKYGKGPHSSVELVPLLQKEVDKNKNYRPIAKEIFKEMFKYAEAKVPSDPILEELVTNCNQSGYVGSLLKDDERKPSTKVNFEHGLSFQSIGYTVHINCDNTSCTAIEVKEPISIRNMENPQEEMHMHSSLKFTLESQNDKDGVTYKKGKLSLNIPEELKNYQEGEKSLFDIIKEYFQKFREKLGFKFETEKVIEQNLKDPLEVNSYLESVEPSAHRDVHGI